MGRPLPGLSQGVAQAVQSTGLGRRGSQVQILPP